MSGFAALAVLWPELDRADAPGAWDRHRRLQESLSYGLALEGISAAQVAALNRQKTQAG
jgi:hypothetical protein